MINRVIDDNCLILEDENNAMLLKITEEIDRDCAVLKLEGNINVNMSHDFEDELVCIAVICNKITIDFEATESISSTGMKTLLSIQQILDRRSNTSLKLKGLKDKVLKIFEDMGFLALFDIEN